MLHLTCCKVAMFFSVVLVEFFWQQKNTMRGAVSIIYEIFSYEELTKTHSVYYTNVHC
jgi:hypothetical protein